MRWPPIVPVMASTSSSWWRLHCPLLGPSGLLPIHRRSNKSRVQQYVPGTGEKHTHDYRLSYPLFSARTLTDAYRTVAEIAYLIDTLKLEGVELLTHIGGSNLDSPDLDPVWQALDARHALVFLHPNAVLGVERLTRYYLLNLLGNPVETAQAL